MRTNRPLLWIAASLAVLVFAAGCDDDTTVPSTTADPMPDFTLRDVNSTSPTFGTGVSPRDHQAVVSAWYFSHAT